MVHFVELLLGAGLEHFLDALERVNNAHQDASEHQINSDEEVFQVTEMADVSLGEAFDGLVVGLVDFELVGNSIVGVRKRVEAERLELVELVFKALLLLEEVGVAVPQGHVLELELSKDLNEGVYGVVELVLMEVEEYLHARTNAAESGAVYVFLLRVGELNSIFGHSELFLSLLVDFVECELFGRVVNKDER